MSERTYGGKYDAKLSTPQIAAIVRGEIKAAVKAGELPAGKYSVRSDSFSGGSSIDVRISDLAGQVWEPEYLERGDEYLMGPSEEDETGWHRPSRYALPVRKAVKRVEAMLAAYNHDGSDIQTDHFDVKFYTSVSVEMNEAEARRRYLAERAATAEAKCPDCGGPNPDKLPVCADCVPPYWRKAPSVPPAESDQVSFLRAVGAL